MKKTFEFLRDHRFSIVRLSHLVLSLASIFVAGALAFNFQFESMMLWRLFALGVIAALLRALVFDIRRTNSRSWRFFSARDTYCLLGSMVLAQLVLVGFFSFSNFFSDVFPSSLILIDAVVAIAMYLGVRLCVRAAYEKYTGRGNRRKKKAKRVLVVGAGEAGTSLLRKLRSEPLEVVGLIDDSWSKQGVRIDGVPVLGGVSDLRHLIPARLIDEVLIAIPSLKKAQLKRITDACIRAKVRFKTIPSLKEIMELKTQIDQLRDVKVEDLLGREPIQLDKTLTYQQIRNQVVLVTGAGGSIGSELCRQILSFRPKKLILLERSEYNLFHIERELLKRSSSDRIVPVIGDILDVSSLEEVFQQYQPSIVYHAAAYKHVPLMEVRPREAVKNNVLGTRNLCDAALKFRAKRFVMISTDKAVRPLSVMGFSKRLAELVVQSRAGRGATEFMSVRFGNVLGSSGSVVEVFRRQLEEGGPLTVTHAEARRFFMTIPEAVELVLHAGTHGHNAAIYMLEMGQPVKIMDLASKMIELADPEAKRNIGVDVIGLRPGEKLTEELLWEGEDMVASNMKSVAMLRNKVKLAGFDMNIKRLERCVESNDCDMEFELKSVVNSIDHADNIEDVIAEEAEEFIAASEPQRVVHT